MKLEMTEERKTRLAYIWAAIALVSSALIWVLVVTESNILLSVFLGGVTILYGPITAFLYLREVKAGVFKVEEEEDE